MKNTLSIALILLLVSCSVNRKVADAKTGNVEKNLNTDHIVSISKSQINKNLDAPISLSEIKKSMEYLASNELEGRATGSKGLEKAAVYIEKFLKRNNIKPYFKTYRDSFRVKNLIGYNIVGVVEGNDPKLKDEFVVLGGHYDHIGKAEEVHGDEIANGANDDASGTIAAMEFAKYFAQTKTNKRSILVTLYDAEEIGLKGSEHLAKRLKKENLNLYTMINFEMIGVPRAANKPMAYMSGYERSNFAKTLNKYAGEEVIGFFAKAKEFGLFMRSDNYPFYKAFKKPAHAISTFDFTNFDYYHHVDDEADKMDYEHMTSFINKMLPALEGMINAPTQEIKMNNE